MRALLILLLPATPPSQHVPLREQCKASAGCYVMLVTTEDDPPKVPVAAPSLKPPALPRAPGGDFDIVHSCAPQGWSLAVVPKKDELHVKLQRAFNDASFKPTAVTLSPRPQPWLYCAGCPLASCPDAVTCAEGTRCVS